MRGLYRYTRNPIYLGVLSVVLGWAALRPAVAGALLMYAALVASAVHTFVVRYEEPQLQALFGAEYAAYTAQACRWLPRPPGQRQT